MAEVIDLQFKRTYSKYSWGHWECNKPANFSGRYVREADYMALHAQRDELLEALKKLLGVLDAHEVVTMDCDRRGDTYCDCLDTVKIKSIAAIRRVEEA